MAFENTGNAWQSLREAPPVNYDSQVGRFGSFFLDKAIDAIGITSVDSQNDVDQIEAYLGGGAFGGGCQNLPVDGRDDIHRSTIRRGDMFAINQVRKCRNGLRSKSVDLLLVHRSYRCWLS